MRGLLDRKYVLILVCGFLVTFAISACTHLSDSFSSHSLNKAGGGIADMPPALGELD